MQARLALAALILGFGPAAAAADSSRYADTIMDPRYCALVAGEAAATAPQHRIVIDAGDARAGAPVTVNWTAAEQPERMPAYLVVALDGPVRLAGDNVYGLTAGAAAPFDVEFGQGSTRAIVPLQQSTLPRQGSFEVIPLASGSLHARTAFVTMTGCGAEVHNEAETALEIAPGVPQIQLADAFDLSAPDESHLSADGTRRLDIFAGRWRLLDAATGDLLTEQAGRTPRFSPTGRFVVSLATSTTDLFDAFDGGLVSSFPELDPAGISEVGWIANDSFLLLGADRLGAVALLSTLSHDRVLIVSYTSCNACSAYDDALVSVDLENSVVIVAGNGLSPEPDRGAEAATLTGADRYDRFGDSGYDSIERFLMDTSAVVIFGEMRRIAHQPGLRLTMLLGNAGRRDGFKPQEGEPAPGGEDWDAALAAYVEPVVLAQGDGEAAADGTVATPRGAVALSPTARDRSGAMKRRIDEFGIPIYAAERFAAISRDSLVRIADMNDGSGQAPAYTLSGDPSVAVVESLLSFSCGEAVAASADGPKLAVHIGSFNEPAAWTWRGAGRQLTLFNGHCAGGSSGSIVGTLFLHDSRFPGQIVNLDANFALPALSFATGCQSSMSGCPFRLGLAHGRYMLIWSREARAAAVYDIERRRMQASLHSLASGALLDEISVSPDGRTLVQMNEDGSFAVFDIVGRPGTYIPQDRAEPGAAMQPDLWTKQAAPMLNGAYRDDEIVVWTPNGAYDATYEGAAQVNLRLPGLTGRYAIGQFESLLRRPGLAEAVVGRRFDDSPITIAAPPTIGARIAREEDRIAVEVGQRFGGALREILVFQDGLLTDRLAAAGSRQVRASVPARPGGRNATVLAVDEAGLSSLPLGVDLPPQPGGGRRLTVLAIGVDEYRHAAFSKLDFAASDARRFAATIAEGSPLYREIRDELLVDEDASPQALRDAVEKALAGAGSETDVMLFFAGHGVQDEAGRLYLALAASDPADLAGTAVAWDDLAARLTATRARVSIFLDACHSGLAGQGMFATNDAAVDALLAANASGIAVFAASKGRELSLETASVGGGVFTSALTQVLGSARRAHDANGDGLISAAEAFRGLKRQVVSDTRGVQTPWFARNLSIGDFPLF